MRLTIVRGEVDAQARAFKATCIEALTADPSRAEELRCLGDADDAEALVRCSASDMVGLAVKPELRRLGSPAQPPRSSRAK